MVAGSLVSDRYRIEEKIAAGGMGAVYAATDERLGRRVAVKVLKEGLADDARFVERFRREARAAGALSHPNVAGVYDFGEDAGRYYMVMELARGRDLARVLREEGPLSPERAVRITSQIARALEHAHAAGVVHRDVKPPNVIVDETDTVKVTDFGIARAVGDATLTATGSVLGTAHYISPEQAGGAQVGPPSDIYSLGIVLYEMLTGALPFTGDSAVAVAMRHVSDEVPPPSELNPDVPESLDQVVARATAKEPEARFRDGRDMAANLESAVSGAAEGATAALPSTGATAATQQLTQTVWPIPGGRYDPQKLGRRVLLVLGSLVVIALILLLFRLGDSTGEPSQTASRTAPGQAPQAPQEEAPPAEGTAGITVSEDWIGADHHTVEDVLKDAGVKVEKETVASEDLPKDAIVYIEPEVGTELQEGDSITLFISDGAFEEEAEEDEEDVEEGEEGRPEHSKGKGPKKKDD